MSQPDADPFLANYALAQEVMGLHPFLSVRRGVLGFLHIFEGVDTPDREIEVFPLGNGDDQGYSLGITVHTPGQRWYSCLRVPITDGDYRLQTIEGADIADKSELLETIRQGLELFAAYLRLPDRAKPMVWPAKVVDGCRGLSSVRSALGAAGMQEEVTDNLTSLMWTHLPTPMELLALTQDALDNIILSEN